MQVDDILLDGHVTVTAVDADGLCTAFAYPAMLNAAGDVFTTTYSFGQSQTTVENAARIYLGFPV